MSKNDTRMTENLFRVWLIVVAVFVAGFLGAQLFAPSMRPAPEPAGPVGSTGPARTAPARTAPAQDSTVPQAEARTGTGYGRLVTDVPPFDPDKDGHVLVAWSRQGMQHVTDAEPAWTLLPPGSTLRAQLVHRGPGPQAVTEGVTLTWRLDGEAKPSAAQPAAVADSSLTPAGQAATTPSATPAAKGAEGAQGKAPQFSGELKLVEGTTLYEATGIPVLPYVGKDRFNPYPTVTVEARDASGALLAVTRCVLPVSTEMGCRNCHGGPWKVGGVAGISPATAADVLEVHDRINGTDLAQRAKSGTTVVCRDCHEPGGDTAAGKAGAKPSGTPVPPAMSAAIHGWHAAYMGGRGADACNSCHPSAPDGATRFWRDYHVTKGLDCTRCHGAMEDHALSLLRKEQEAGNPAADRLMAAITPVAVQDVKDMAPRTPWVNLPDCAGCHDFAEKPRSATASAFNKWTADAAGLYAERTDDTTMLRCPACHGAPHAVYPARNPLGRDRDNIPPMQYQQHARSMGASGNCFVCHGETPEFSVHHPLVERKAVTVTVPQGAKLAKPRVPFPHEAHTPTVDCGTCHHKGYVDGGPMKCTSAGCHDVVVDAETGTPQERADPRYFRNAFHGEGPSCNACHARLLAAGKAAGPVECRDCHKLKS
ncbi:cytochrome c3 family protein [Nitratidesulfovibrio sp. 1201_IL3209]|uniref:cytochrome c3 family protein n=1 Tax=Nitratidesulfovibrio sp. 1201_IL3209 TaxID=3084053 RepID=UPI002FD9703D